jgi:superkiller protein 3
LKAFEIDSSETTAAYHLVKEFTENLDWNRAEAFTKRLISTDDSKRRLGQDSWPYRVLGMSALESQDEARAIEWFQTAIRIDPKDIDSWIGLGESYFGCGRLEAAVKVFKRALELNPDNWVAKYLLGVVTSHIGEFDESVETLEALLVERPDEECVIAALTESLLKFSNRALLEGFFGRAIGLALEATELLPRGNISSFNYWKSVSDLIQIFIQIKSKIDQFPHDILLKVLSKATIEIDETLVSEYLEKEKIVEIAALFLVYANEAALALDPKSRPLRSSTLYNLGLSQVIAFLETKNTHYRDSAIDNLKGAIKFQNNYAEAWIVLGVATTSVNPRVSQHCYIKASTLDSQNVDIWSNLALLFLRYGDSTLAAEAYARGQSLAPNQPISWLGNALTAEALGDDETAANLFTHAFILGNGRSPSAQLAYGVSVCFRRIGKGEDVKNIESVQEFSSAAYGTLQYLKHYPLDAFGLSITCLILERLNDYELGAEVANKLLNILEKSYEETEDEKDLESFCRVKVQLARFNLGSKDYEAAVSNSLEVLELSSATKTVISSRTVLGLAYFFLDHFDEALDEFKEILNLSGDARQLVVLIAQVLYVYDTEETKQVALDQLFNNIETSGSSLLVTLVIGAISVIEDLEEYWGIIKGELETLSLAQLIEDKFKNVPFLISEIDKKLQEKNPNQALQRSAFYFPSDLSIWKALDHNVSLKIAAQGKVPAEDLSEAYLERHNLGDVQRSIFIAPWTRKVYPLNRG